MTGKSRPTLTEVRKKIENYCAYQERCHQEVNLKLISLGLNHNEITEILVHLTTSGFLNEERYARAFVRGKYRQKSWGRKKIIYHLSAKGINKQLIEIALNEIPKDEYSQTIQELIRQKDQSLKHKDKKQRILSLNRYLIQKGFELDLIIHEVKKYYGL